MRAFGSITPTGSSLQWPGRGLHGAGVYCKQRRTKHGPNFWRFVASRAEPTQWTGTVFQDICFSL